jgi:hypothetical protein
MIWVNTIDAITSWAFSATEPVDKVSGMVWFKTGSTSTVAFNAIKKNCVTIYPMSAVQLVNSEWKSVDAKSYINSKWSNWRRYLFNNGPVEGLGANWVFRTDHSARSSGSVGTTLTMTANVLTGTPPDNYASELYLDSAIDCAGASTLNIHFVKVVTTGKNGEFGLYVNDRATGEKIQSFDNLNETDWTLSVDVTHLNTIQVQLRTNPWYSVGNSCSLTVDSVWFS